MSKDSSGLRRAAGKTATTEVEQSEGWLRRWRRDRSGNVAILFALALVPVLGLIGAAIDFSRAHLAQTKMQGALDAAVLAAASGIQRTDEERIQTAKDIFAADLQSSGLGVIATPNVVIEADGTVKGSVSSTLPSVLLGVLGIDTMGIGADAEVMSTRLMEGEIVLVLDYSGSMGSAGKYQAMRDAAINLVNTLSVDGTIPTVKFGLVPFSAHVYGSMESDFVVNETPGSTWTNCTFDRKWPHNTVDTTPFVSNDDTKWGMIASGGEEEGGGNPYSACSNYPSRNLVIQPLTNNHAATISQLQSMTPYANTHIAVGLAFGWHVLSPNAPWQEGVPYNTANYVKSIVLLTDGRQTTSAWGPSSSTSVPNGESNLVDMCTAIKAQNVLLVTVAFDLQDQATEDRLRDCATSPSYFFDADTNAELKVAFENIATQFAKNMHLSK